ncbi:hypothetical protein [Streptomyces rapamycinicus]|uniref:Helicase n=2 Tax=Streptomyces rapamycinicus TaxID=1226757 RepID=A0A3L8RCZ7_STRRN|nr:hypothetical protein [Streptomyces rapamycinicus]MBB4786881.1 hypothetical protein [Streptomyces rapamycinicus]RLV77664.1 helicase [Streptomyces rapamycinicus NRRL 5491]UTO66908.1 hypothetical protein LJB45_34370 [Streptomyces rapamycinicus]UTP34863.1 hypothetical protein LIV37_39500 [Streptomyces rapamycinicus NRRL 5491]
MTHFPAPTGLIANYFNGNEKLFLAHTHPAVDNLKRRVSAQKSTFRTISSHIGRSDVTDYDVLVIDECRKASTSSVTGTRMGWCCSQNSPVQSPLRSTVPSSFGSGPGCVRTAGALDHRFLRRKNTSHLLRVTATLIA